MDPSTTSRHDTLRLLGIFHFVYAGLVLLGSLMPIFWLALAGLWWPELAADAGRDGEVPAMMTGTLGMVLLSFGVLLSWLWVAVLALAGRSLMIARRHTFCVVVAAVACLSVPLGTVLGVATLVVLHRPGTRELFEPTVRNPAPPGSGPASP